MSEFDRFQHTYERQLDDVVRCSGQDREFFTRAKTRTLLDLVRKRVGDPASLAAVDVGCGVGLTVTELRGKFASISGVDISAAMIERAREREPGVDFRAYDGAALPYESGSVDVAFTICVLHHVPRPERAAFMSELGRIVRPGGLLVIGEHNPVNPLTRIVVSRCAFDVDAELLTARESVRLLRSAGGDGVEHRYILFLPFESNAVDRVEAVLRRVPLGAQYVACGVKAAA